MEHHMVQIYPSLISGDIMNLERTITLLEPHCAGFHLDVMDFDFVPNLTWGPVFINAIRKISKKQLWIDLLAQHPEKYLDLMELKKDDIISVHLESQHEANIFAKIRARGLLASLALDPRTDLTNATNLVGEIDHILLMSVRPGFSGQEFIPESVDRLEQLHALLEHLHRKPLVGMDGGLNQKTLPKIVEIGIDTVAIAKGIFGQPDPVEALKKLSGQ